MDVGDECGTHAHVQLPGHPSLKTNLQGFKPPFRSRTTPTCQVGCCAAAALLCCDDRVGVEAVMRTCKRVITRAGGKDEEASISPSKLHANFAPNSLAILPDHNARLCDRATTIAPHRDVNLTRAATRYGGIYRRPDAGLLVCWVRWCAFRAWLSPLPAWSSPLPAWCLPVGAASNAHNELSWPSGLR